MYNDTFQRLGRVGLIHYLEPFKVNPDTSSDVTNIAHGVCSPLEGFMIYDDYISVLDQIRPSNDILCTVPIVLDAPSEVVKDLKEGMRSPSTWRTGLWLP